MRTGRSRWRQSVHAFAKLSPRPRPRTSICSSAHRTWPLSLIFFPHHPTPEADEPSKETRSELESSDQPAHTMADDPVPIFTTVLDAHPLPAIAAREAARFDALAAEFTRRFGHAPAYIARAPGRVNLIGEHIDYALFGVFPAAVEQDVLIACARRPGPAAPDADAGHVHAQNLNERYAPQAFAPMLRTALPKESVRSEEAHVHVKEWHLDIDPRELRWESYVKAGYYGVLEKFFAGPAASSEPANTDILVTGTVPAGSGLSSSAAMVVASTLAFLAVNDKLELPAPGGTRRITKGELVAMAVENETRVGVNSGGMDQAASVTALPESALYIHFFPAFGAAPVPLPIRRTRTKAVWVIANSLVKSEKVVSAKTRYNLRVVETLVAARVLARALRLDTLTAAEGGTKRVTLREVLAAHAGSGEVRGRAAPSLAPEDVKAALEGILPEVERLRAGRVRRWVRGDEAGEGEGGEEQEDGELGLTYDEMVAASGLAPEVFREVYLSWVEVEATHFQLYKRARHVFGEALRVLQFRDVCLAAAADGAEELADDVLRALGALMDASQDACSTLFECSCPELDQLTRLCRDAGAYGSRLTGAGWGGCTVSLVAEAAVPAFIARLRASYPAYRALSDAQLKDVVFATQPSNGAFVFKVTE
ncbi:galactokinase [Phanerochaete sordida]|uniref:Galactokinase n=1 Tax=Phanerochaete sordida TaxID=48140 RepID=A0A9P3G7Q0_9APHY|nr:galactokinase [Phanerochaete sordida]